MLNEGGLGAGTQADQPLKPSNQFNSKTNVKEQIPTFSYLIFSLLSPIYQLTS